MPALQRSVSLRGAKFYRQGASLMFVLHLDASTRVGPREAIVEDLEAWPDAFAAFEADDDGGALGPLKGVSEQILPREAGEGDRPRARPEADPRTGYAVEGALPAAEKRPLRRPVAATSPVARGRIQGAAG
jgi:hypothetical protein